MQHAGEPWRAFAAPDPRSVRPFVRPIAAAWWPSLAAGALVGVLLAALTVWFATWLGARRRVALPWARALTHAATHADPALAGPRLHVVSGSTAGAVMRAALELAARRIALGERVLVVDGSAALRLHERLGRDARWGLLECLAADMPVLGLVQYAGHPGLYLLPHGNAERAVGWSSLGRKLDEVVPHFGRIVLALDPHAPAAIGDAVRGRAMEGWWAGTDRRAATAADLATARFGIVFNGLDLSEMSDASLEVMAERVIALRPPGPAPEAAPITARAVPRKPPMPPMAQEPIVLDCDLQVRQRLRFLAWMRRVRGPEPPSRGSGSRLIGGRQANDDSSTERSASRVHSVRRIPDAGARLAGAIVARTPCRRLAPSWRAGVARLAVPRDRARPRRGPASPCATER